VHNALDRYVKHAVCLNGMAYAGRYAAAIGASYLAGLVGSLFIGADVGVWYAQLAKPTLTPPAWIFFPAWMILYGLMGVALGIIWSKTALWHPWVGCFFVSLAFNAAWTMFFFGFHAILLALTDVVSLAIILIALVLGAGQMDRRATYLLLPYLAWVLFAVYLNSAIWYLN